MLSRGMQKKTNDLPFTTTRELHARDLFFQAEDGIRDYKVTGVQTCALPILSRSVRSQRRNEALRRFRASLPQNARACLSAGVHRECDRRAWIARRAVREVLRQE